MTEEEFKNILLRLNIGNEEFFTFIKGKVHSFPMNDDMPWICHPVLDDNGIIVDIKLLVPKIVDKRTLLINIHEYTHAFELFLELGKSYIPDEENREIRARNKEQEYLDLGNR